MMNKDQLIQNKSPLIKKYYNKKCKAHLLVPLERLGSVHTLSMLAEFRRIMEACAIRVRTVRRARWVNTSWGFRISSRNVLLNKVAAISFITKNQNMRKITNRMMIIYDTIYFECQHFKSISNLMSQCCTFNACLMWAMLMLFIRMYSVLSCCHLFFCHPLSSNLQQSQSHISVTPLNTITYHIGLVCLSSVNNDSDSCHVCLNW